MARVPKVKLKINLQELFGRRVPDDPDLRRSVAEAAIDRIIERTQSGVDADGSRFAPYTEKYAKQKGVSRNAVDMTLFGDMLQDLSIIDETSQTVTLGFSDSLQNAKAYNHINADTLPVARNFFGQPKDKDSDRLFALSEEDVPSVIDRVDFEAALDDDTELSPAAERLVERILAGDFDEDLGL